MDNCVIKDNRTILTSGKTFFQTRTLSPYLIGMEAFDVRILDGIDKRKRTHIIRTDRTILDIWGSMVFTTNIGFAVELFFRKSHFIVRILLTKVQETETTKCYPLVEI
jgi:hypothetical protein